MTLTQRVLIGSVSILVLLAVLVVALADHRLDQSLVQDSVQELSREARMVAAEWRPGVNADSLADSVGHFLRRRVTLIDSSGHVIGDTEFDPPALNQLQNHYLRPEVVSARESGLGWSRRASPSAGDEELYVAVRARLGYARISMSTRELADITQMAERDVLFAALIAVIVATLVTIVFVRGVVRPIANLRDVARSMAQGDLARRPALSAPGEVGDLADALARMGEQLEIRLNKLETDDALVTAMIESLNEGVIAIDTSGRVVRANPRARELLGVRQPVPFPSIELPRDRQLRDAIAAALAGTVTDPVETTFDGKTLAITARPLRDGGGVLALLDLTPFRKLDAVRRDFVANVSHELRTPLTVINGFAETLVGNPDLGQDEHQFAEMIRSNARRMQAIVDELLDLSRIESGGWKPAPTMVDIKTAANEVISSFESALAQRRVSVAVDVDGVPTVYADPTALRQVLANLVSNAVRHTENGTVTIAARREGDGVTLSVRDTGAGIPADHLPRIFERFYRVDPGRSRAEGGTGLGLSIVRHLVEAHGGRVKAESVVRQGTTVSATFPQPTL